MKCQFSEFNARNRFNVTKFQRKLEFEICHYKPSLPSRNITSIVVLNCYLKYYFNYFNICSESSEVRGPADEYLCIRT